MSDHSLQRQIGAFSVNPIGLGCMSMSQSYGPADAEESARLLDSVIEMGYDFLDTAALYGGGHNEELLGRHIGPYREKITLASKCGMFWADGKKVIDGSPAAIRQTCEDSLRRLRTDRIDLYYLHRRDFKVPIEDSVGELARLKDEGKILSFGLSEVSAVTLRRAQAVHPIAALQSEYSLWTRNPEIALLEACEELNVALVAFSPLGRKFLTGTLTDTASLTEDDLRLKMPRFQEAHFQNNLALLSVLKQVAEELACTPGQVALVWLLNQGQNVIPIPGTKHVDYARENIAALKVAVSEAQLSRLDAAINQGTVSGARYSAVQQPEIDTEQFADEPYQDEHRA